MGDKEKYEQKKTCHIYLALKRKKDNQGQQGKKIHRQIIYDEDSDLEIIKTKCSSTPGVWRIHRTVNERDMVKALKNFRHTIIDNEKTSIESLWRKELLQPCNKATKYFMIDVDGDLTFMDIKQWLEAEDIIFSCHKSPKGFHIVTEPFNRQEFSKSFDCDVLVDGYVFIEQFEVK